MHYDVLQLKINFLRDFHIFWAYFTFNIIVSLFIKKIYNFKYPYIPKKCEFCTPNRRHVITKYKKSHSQIHTKWSWKNKIIYSSFEG